MRQIKGDEATERANSVRHSGRKGKPFFSIRILFVLLVVMTSVPSLLVLGWVGYNARIRTIDLVSNSAGDFSAGMAASVALIDEVAVSYVNSLAERQNVMTLDYVRSSMIFKERIAGNPLFGDIMLTTISGDVLASGRDDSPRSVAPVFETVSVIGDEIVRGEGYIGKPYDEIQIPYIRGLHPDDGGKPQFALLLLVRGSIFSQIVERVRPPRGMRYSLLDRSGRFVFRYPGAQKETGEKISGIIWEMLATIKQTENSMYLEHEGDPERYLGFAALRDENGEPWLIVLTSLLQKDTVAEVSRATNRAIGLVLLCIICISSVALYVGSKHIVLPIERLVSVTNRLAKGDLSQRAGDDSFTKEIATLAQSFDEMALALEQRVRLGRSINEEVREQANKDFLTGAFNRRAGLSILGNTMTLSLANKHPFAIIFIDLDRFKSINDTYGHAEGDALLIRASGFLSSHLRGDDMLCRYGGDEFLIVLPNCDEQGVAEAWSRIRENVALFNKSNEHPYDISLSHGSAVFDPEKPISLDELIETADKAMYFDKEYRKRADMGQTGSLYGDEEHS